jgi:hypothetical protein
MERESPLFTALPVFFSAVVGTAFPVAGLDSFAAGAEALTALVADAALATGLGLVAVFLEVITEVLTCFFTVALAGLGAGLETLDTGFLAGAGFLG